MKDSYPSLPTLPSEHLVLPAQQPDYLELSGVHVPASANAAEAILARGPQDAVALIHHEGGSAHTFRELARESARLAAALEASGISVGHRVAIRSTNRPEAVVAILAAWRLGAVVVPIPPSARPAELSFFLQDTGASALIAYGEPRCFDDVLPALEETPVATKIAFGEEVRAPGWTQWEELPPGPARPNTPPSLPENLPALIWHTGGTTGVPKACYHTHRRYLLGGHAFVRAARLRTGERWAAAAPIGHALGFLCHTTFTLLHGATVVLIENHNRPEALLEALSSHEVETFVGITATWARLLDTLAEHPELDRLPSLRRGYAMWQSASSGAVWEGWKERGIELLNNFGSTAFANWILVPQGQVPRASLGRATEGYEVIAIDEEAQWVPQGKIGRMAVRGPTGLTYWNRPLEQRRDVVDGWTLVDDLISFDSGGNAAYFGRTDFVISSAGHKIAPIEVEQVLSRHPAVAEVGVVGAPDPVRQEIVAAFVVCVEGCEPSDALRRELQDFVKANLSPYKYPRQLEFIDAIPRDHVGKVQTRVLKAWADRSAAEGTRA